MKKTDRRQFLKSSALYTAGALLSSEVVYANKLPNGIGLLGLENVSATLADKHPDMIVLNDRPINCLLYTSDAADE